MHKETIEAVLKLLDCIAFRDTGTYEHSRRVADCARHLAARLGLSPDRVEDIVLAARVMDLGTLGIPSDILLKEGELTSEGRRVLEEHPVIGANVLSSYSAFKGSVDMVKHHHERWDGRGYPARLKGEEIPLGARIIAVVDAWDSMTTDRPYRRGMSPEEAVERLKAGMGSQFDMKVCAPLIQILIEDGV